MQLKVILALAVATLSFWTGVLHGDVSEAAIARSPSSEGAAVSFGNLENGDVVPPEFHVKFSISGMGIAPAGVEIDSTGHHHLLIDVAKLPDFNQPLPANSNIIHFGKGETETVLELAEGEHTLQLVLADYRHIPHEPPVISEIITIKVSANAPAQGSE